MWGIVPAAGRGSRIQPLVFSKELLPVGSRLDHGVERPCAVSEYLVERLIRGGADKICFVIGPGKSDIMAYYGSGYGDATAVYAVQPSPAGLCDPIFRVTPLVSADEVVLVGLPDTVWFPKDGLAALPEGRLSFLLFPVDHPELFDAVVIEDAASRWIWCAFKTPGRTLHALRALWLERGCRDEYVGTLVNAYIAAGGEVVGVKAGETYVDVGTVHGYRAAMRLLAAAADRGRRGAGQRTETARARGVAVRARGQRRRSRKVTPSQRSRSRLPRRSGAKPAASPRPRTSSRSATGSFR